MAKRGGGAELIPGLDDLPLTPRRPGPPAAREAVTGADGGPGSATPGTPRQGTVSPGGTSGAAGAEPATAPTARGPAGGRAARRKGARTPAGTLPVARVAVDIPLPHLDRLFDYLVPAGLEATAVPGCRVRVRFAGQLVDGFLIERAERSDHEGRLAYLERVTSPEPVLSPEIAALAREVADRFAGTFADVVRLAVPPRHARVEAESPRAPHDVAGSEDGIRTDDQDGTDTGTDTGTGESAGAVTAVTGGLMKATATDPTADLADLADLAGMDRTADTGGPEPGPWSAYPAGPSFLDALAAGRAPRAVWTAMPGPDWPAAIARAVHATVRSGRGALVVAAGGGEVARVDAALSSEFTAESGTESDSVSMSGTESDSVSGTADAVPTPGAGRPNPGARHRHVALTAELGPAERYRRWLAVRRGQVKVVVGTRAAMFAPVAELGLVVLWDDGDDVHAEPHAPYPHAREVLALRAHRTGAGALIGGFARTTDTTQLVEAGWAHALVPGRAALRSVMPRVLPAGDDTEAGRDEGARIARLPDLALRTARRALERGPVLVQVPRRGYLPALACAHCRGPARCRECQGPLALRSSHGVPQCRWCGRIAGGWDCPECGCPRVRAIVVGAGRTAEELGRAFPGVTVRTSGRGGVLDRVGAEPGLVVATPGAEPVAAGAGYAAALLLDGWALLARADLRAGEEALRRWMNAAALVGPAGPVVVLAEGALAPVQALLRWDPVTFAERELDERRQLGFPPAARMASLTGGPAALRDLLETVRLPDGAEILGPVPVPVPPATRGAPPVEQERALVRVPRPAAVALAQALKAAQGVRSARKASEVVRVRIDPLELI